MHSRCARSNIPYCPHHLPVALPPGHHCPNLQFLAPGQDTFPAAARSRNTPLTSTRSVTSRKSRFRLRVHLVGIEVGSDIPWYRWNIHGQGAVAEGMGGQASRGHAVACGDG